LVVEKSHAAGLREGFEASFIALRGDPVIDFRNVRRITLRFKQGPRLVP
jgi:hypothetical protein